MNKKKKYFLYAIIVILIVACAALYLKNSSLNRQMNLAADELISIAQERDELIKTNKILTEEKNIVSAGILNISSVFDEASAELEKIRSTMGLSEEKPSLEKTKESEEDKNQKNEKEEATKQPNIKQDDGKTNLSTEKPSVTKQPNSNNGSDNKKEIPFVGITEKPNKEKVITPKPAEKELSKPFTAPTHTINQTAAPKATEKPTKQQLPLTSTPKITQKPSPNSSPFKSSTVKP